MKAFKGCVNHECKSYVKKVSYKDKFEFCPLCASKLEYVCADCWKVLGHNTDRLCIACKTNHEQKRAQQINNVKAVGAVVVGIAGTTWKNKDKIVQVGKKAINIIKK